jgi:hypothetical protein
MVQAGKGEVMFDGDTFVQEADGVRLAGQLERVRGLMIDLKWRTLGEIAAAIGAGSEAAVSARLRDLRKQKFGGHVVNRRRRGEAKRGLFEYQLVAKMVQRTMFDV